MLLKIIDALLNSPNYPRNEEELTEFMMDEEEEEEWDLEDDEGEELDEYED